MSAAAYLRNGVTPPPKSTYFDLQPIAQRAQAVDGKVPAIPREYKPYRPPLIPSASHVPHTRLVLGLKPYPFSIRTGIDPGPVHHSASQGYGRHQKKGLAYKLDGKDHTQGKLMPQADSTYASMNNKIPLPT